MDDFIRELGYSEFSEMDDFAWDYAEEIEMDEEESENEEF